MSGFMSPVETSAAMKAALFLFLFILLSSLRPDIHYSFYLLRGRTRHWNFSSLQMLSLLWFKSVSKPVLIQMAIAVLCRTVQKITLRKTSYTHYILGLLFDTGLYIYKFEFYASLHGSFYHFSPLQATITGLS